MKARLMIIVIAVLFLMSLTMMSCDEKLSKIALTPDRDVAESIAGAVSIGTGGVIDQISDLCEMLYVDSTKFEDVLFKDIAKSGPIIVKTYDSTTGYWNIRLERTRGLVGEIPYAHLNRVYTLQYLDRNGNPQMNYVTNAGTAIADTARTVHFNIKSGTGNYITRRISQQLDSLDAEWTVTNAHKAMVNIQGNYFRAARDTISGFERTRISNHKLHLNFANLEVPRGPQPNLYHAVSGALSGSIIADVTFTSGDAYSETHIERTFNINFGLGKGAVTIGNKTYQADLYSGEIVD